MWKNARIFIVSIYKFTSKFPKSETFGLTSQIQRAAISVALNIAEGSDRRSDADFKRFLRIALGSIDEVVTGLYIALDLNFIEKKEFDALYENSHKITSQIRALISKL
ncbi:MAG: four helix bundle protein [Candidatus Yanofskybacteria bacterium]|nr:four helix bundle protein [Candidatus Yanofskybacteria bacterium]